MPAADHLRSIRSYEQMLEGPLQLRAGIVLLHSNQMSKFEGRTSK